MSETPGTPLPLPTATLLLNDLQRLQNSLHVVCDGFPSACEHLPLLPPRSIVALVHCDDGLREARLEQRAAQTSRGWTPGLASERDALVGRVFDQAISLGITTVTLNNSGPMTTIEQLLSRMGVSC